MGFYHIGLLLLVGIVYCSADVGEQFAQLQKLEGAKDSYGNPVTPFPLSNDELKLRAGSYKVDKTGFIIPSYASGITDVHDPHLPRLKKPDSNILPPFSSGNFYYPGVKPQVSTETVFVDRTDDSANELPQPPQLPNIPDIGSTAQSTLIEIPSDGLLPPLESDQYESQYNQPFNTNVPVPQKDILPPFPTSQPAQTSSGVQFSLPSNPPVIEPFAPTRIDTAPVHPVFIPNPTPAAVPTTTSTGNKYTGGFGFANGAKPTTVFVVHTVDDNQALPSQTPQLTTTLQAPLSPSTSDGNKYTGGFVAPTVPSPIPTKPDSDRYAGGFAPTNNAPVYTPTSDTGNKYTGGFGYANGAQPIPAPSQQSQQTHQPQQHQHPNIIVAQSTGQKYTGGFGGPPGLLVPFDHIHTFARVSPDEQQ